MKATGALLLRGMRWRLGTSLLTVLTTMIAVGAAVLGPLYLHAAGDSVIRTTVGGAAPDATGVTLAAAPAQAATLGQIEAAEHRVTELGGLHSWYGTPITSVISGVGLVGPQSSPWRSQLLARTGACAVLRFRAGSCDLRLGDVVVSDRSARELGVSLGANLAGSVQGSSVPLRLHVTGIYRTPNLDLPYWWGNGAGYFPFGHTVGHKGIPELDSLIASRATALAVPTTNLPQIVGQVPLRIARVGLGDKTALEHALSGASAVNAGQGIALTTQLPGLLAQADSQRRAMATIVVIAAVQLVVLAIWILAGLLARSSEARQPEMRVARLRGFPAASLLMVTAAEPAVLCLLGAVAGVAAAWTAVTVARDRLLDPAATIAPDLWTFAAVAATMVAIAGSLALGTLRVMRRSALSHARSPTRTSSTRASVVVDAVLLVLSVVALIALATSGALDGRTNPIASAAPGLIALGVAVVAVQVVLLGCRAGVAASAYTDRVAAFLGLRQIVRRPALLRQARVLIIALCLACFAASAWSVARTNRAAAARFSVGASEVVNVTPQGVDLVSAVRNLDPRGRFAMAAEVVATPSSTVLAVDAHRLAAVASWPRQISATTASAASRALLPSGAPEIHLGGTQLQLTAEASATAAAASALKRLDLALWVFNPQGGTSIIDLGALRAGRSTYRGSLADACAAGCRLAGVGVVPAPNRSAPAAGTVSIRVLGLATRSSSGGSRSSSADLSSGGWRPLAPGVKIRPAPGGLNLAIPASTVAAYVGALGSISRPMVEPADHPMILPGVVTGEVESINGGSAAGESIPAEGLDLNNISIRPAVTASAVPRLGDTAVMVDLDLLRRTQLNPTAPEVTNQVWLGSSAPGDVLSRLRAAGLRVDAVQTASEVVHQMQRTGPALADDFLLVATIVALIAAAASTLGFLGANTRRRATELTALEVGGVRRPVLMRSLAVESGVLALTALFGLVAGIVAAAMAIPSLPELTGPATIPLRYALPGGLMAAVSAAVVAVVVLATVAVGLILLRRMSPVLLRTAPDDTAG